MDYMCCGPWMRHGREKTRQTIGIALILVGTIWFGTKMGWVDFTWMQNIPFFPLAAIAVGLWLVYRSATAKKGMGSENHKEV